MFEPSEVQIAAEAFRRARRDLLHWESLLDKDGGAEPNRYIIEIQAAEKRVEATRLALRKLSRG